MTFMGWMLSIFSTTTVLDLLEAGLRHSVWLWMSLAGAALFVGVANRAHHFILRAALLACAFGLALSGVLNTAVWIEARFQLTAPIRTLAAWQSQQAAYPTGKRVLVLNAPDQITLNSSIAWLQLDAESLQMREKVG